MQVDVGVPRTQAGSSRTALKRAPRELRWRWFDVGRMGGGSNGALCAGRSSGDCGAAHVRSAATGAENTGRPLDRFPFFVRMAYGWLLVAALLGVGAALWDSSGGIWGASRHALTVGFIAVMVFCVGQRILPAFAGMRLLWSTHLMFAGLLRLTIGCTLRVSSEVLAYQGYANWAWSVLPISALLELAGITAFAVNISGTFILEPSHVQKQPLVMRIN